MTTFMDFVTVIFAFAVMIALLCVAVWAIASMGEWDD
jgi:hypothetical protein